MVVERRLFLRFVSGASGGLNGWLYVHDCARDSEAEGAA